MYRVSNPRQASGLDDVSVVPSKQDGWSPAPCEHPDCGEIADEFYLLRLPDVRTSGPDFPIVAHGFGHAPTESNPERTYCTVWVVAKPDAT